jgi:hypothetical protein
LCGRRICGAVVGAGIARVVGRILRLSASGPNVPEDVG